MPGILYHLAFAEEVYRNFSEQMKLDKVNFMAGNLIPDLANDKKASHYRKKASVNGFFVPTMESVKKDLFVPSDSVKFGMYCHLYLDYYFIEDFLIPEFIWDTSTMKVINPRNHKEWDVKTFFSHDGMYGSYTEINDLMLKDGHVSLETVSQIPEILPSLVYMFLMTDVKKPGKLNLTDICLSIKNILVTSLTTIVCGLLSKKLRNNL